FPRASHADDAVFEAAAKRANALVHEIAHGLGGSIAAEHGVGASLRDRLPAFKAPIEIELMRGIKALLDPLGLMNPGKVVPAPPS
ncbi:MAG: hypothetical protein JNK11_18965, partial [Alphaproteobacteria bacterium]|nr:hypothetical protein [Alphaproteobacteria bacterium]